jgi:Flp pilus assembly protein TadG
VQSPPRVALVQLVSTPSLSLTREQDGQALVEFVLVLPLILLLFLGMLDFGKAYNYWSDANQLSAEGARFAVVNRKPNPTDAASMQVQIRNSADTSELRSGGSTAVASPAQVCIDFPNGTSNVGDPVRVRVSFTYTFLPFIGNRLPALSKAVDTTSIMRLEATPTNYSAGCA